MALLKDSDTAGIHGEIYGDGVLQFLIVENLWGLVKFEMVTFDGKMLMLDILIKIPSL